MIIWWIEQRRGNCPFAFEPCLNDDRLLACVRSADFGKAGRLLRFATHNNKGNIVIHPRLADKVFHGAGDALADILRRQVA